MSDAPVTRQQEVKALHEETEAIYKENQSLNRQQIALNEEVRDRSAIRLVPCHMRRQSVLYLAKWSC